MDTEALMEHPCRRAVTEQWLNSRGATWEFVIASPADFDLEKSLANQARFESLKERVIDEYVVAMERGDIFPAVVAFRDPITGKLVIIDGNHRLNSQVRINARDVPVYIVSGVSPENITLLTYEANATHGEKTSEDERLAHAIHLMDEAGLTAVDAAAAVRLKESRVRAGYERAKADRRAAKVGVPDRIWKKLTMGSRTKLASLHTDDAFGEACKIAVEAVLTGTEVNSLVSVVNRERSAEGQMVSLGSLAEEYKGRVGLSGGGVIKKGGFSAFNRFLGLLATIENLDVEAIAQTAMVSTETARINSRCLQAAEKLMLASEAIERRQAFSPPVNAVAPDSHPLGT